MKTWKISNGPDRYELITKFVEGKSVYFSCPEENGGVAIFISSIEREDGSGCNFNLYGDTFSVYYNTERRTGHLKEK